MMWPPALLVNVRSSSEAAPMAGYVFEVNRVPVLLPATAPLTKSYG